MAKQDKTRADVALVAVRFTTRDAPYNAGDVRLFPERAAKKLVGQGVAELVAVGEEAVNG